jgi:hypothetical protein
VNPFAPSLNSRRAFVKLATNAVLTGAAFYVF